MNMVKKTVAALSAALLMLGTAAGCSSNDNSWAMKNDEMTLPIGVYIYYLDDAYQAASSKVADTSVPVLDQQIDGKAADQWIRETALQSCKRLYVVKDKMKELNLSLTEDERTAVNSRTDSYWEQMGAELSGYGIAKTSFGTAYSEYSANVTALFKAIYGKGGTKEVPDADLKKELETNYADFEMMSAPLMTAGEDGNSTAMTDDEKKAMEEKFNGYVKDIEGGKAMQDISAAYAEDNSLQDSYTAETIRKDSGDYPQEIMDALAEMKDGEVRTLRASSLYEFQIILRKNNISTAADKFLADEDQRISLLGTLKFEEMTNELNTLADSYSGLQVNDASLNGYNPKMFVKPVSSAAPSSAPASSGAASN